MQNMLEKSLNDVKFTIFDTETTGDNKNRPDKPIELAIVDWNINKGIISTPKSWLFNPEMPIHPAAIAVHGLVDEDVENSPTLEETLPEIHEQIQDNILVAHNISFDLDMLPSFKESDNVKIDTLRFFRQLYKIGDLGYKDQPLYSHKMQEIRYWLNLKIDTNGEQAHRATADILVTAAVFSEAIKKYISLGNGDTLKELVDFINAPILNDKMMIGKFKGLLIEDCIKQEISNPKNYFKWLYSEIAAGKMQLDPDFQYSIDFYLKKAGVDPQMYMVPMQKTSWPKK